MSVVRVRRAFLDAGEVAALAVAARPIDVGVGSMAQRDLAPALSAKVVAWLGARQLWGSYLTVYPAGGGGRAPHRDPAPPGSVLSHWRLIVLVQAPGRGGELVLGGETLEWAVGDAVEIRADLVEHEVRAVTDAPSRVVFTVGALGEQAQSGRTD